ncbi:MAG TPA: hypothetical protein VF533_04745, partial [Solirubrobacteraceae bacterium]
TITTGRRVLARGSAKRATAGKVTVALRATARGRRALRARRVKAKLRLRFTPRGGAAVTRSAAVKLRRR